MYLGVHVSIAGSIADSLDRAHALKCNAMQIFSRNPRQWRQLALTEDDVKEFRQHRRDYGIGYVVVHIPYLINLASPYKVLYRKSIAAYIEDLEESDRLGAEYLVTHMGSHAKTSELAGIDRFAEALNTIFKKTKGVKTKLLLENTAGSGSWLGYKFEHQKMIYSRVEQRERLGLCIDTAHAFTAGYDLKKEEGFAGLVNDIDRFVGLEQVKVIHLNDSKKEFGSHLDQHDHIGKGKIGSAGLRRVVQSPHFKDTVFILETPKKSENDDKRNLAVVRKMVK